MGVRSSYTRKLCKYGIYTVFPAFSTSHTIKITRVVELLLEIYLNWRWFDFQHVIWTKMSHDMEKSVT